MSRPIATYMSASLSALTKLGLASTKCGSSVGLASIVSWTSSPPISRNRLPRSGVLATTRSGSVCAIAVPEHARPTTTMRTYRACRGAELRKKGPRVRGSKDPSENVLLGPSDRWTRGPLFSNNRMFRAWQSVWKGKQDIVTPSVFVRGMSAVEELNAQPHAVRVVVAGKKQRVIEVVLQPQARKLGQVVRE